MRGRHDPLIRDELLVQKNVLRPPVENRANMIKELLARAKLAIENPSQSLLVVTLDERLPEETGQPEYVIRGEDRALFEIWRVLRSEKSITLAGQIVVEIGARPEPDGRRAFIERGLVVGQIGHVLAHLDRRMEDVPVGAGNEGHHALGIGFQAFLPLLQLDDGSLVLPLPVQPGDEAVEPFGRHRKFVLEQHSVTLEPCMLKQQGDGEASELRHEFTSECEASRR